MDIHSINLAALIASIASFGFSTMARKLRISAMVINRFGERDQSGRWCCAVNGL
ncbi:transposase [Burkholderia multivorans CGD1]|nr:transposase [Burkholderia multivorans CGD1]